MLLPRNTIPCTGVTYPYLPVSFFAASTYFAVFAFATFHSGRRGLSAYLVWRPDTRAGGHVAKHCSLERYSRQYPGGAGGHSGA